MYPIETDALTSLVSRVLSIEDITHGDAKSQYLVRYRGLLRIESAAAYEQLADLLRPLEITPLFRMDEGRHAILLVKGVIRPRPSKIWVNVLLFVLTVVSMLITGVVYSMGNDLQATPAPDLTGLLQSVSANLGNGLAFAVSLMAILLAHEFGHYLAGRANGTAVSLPYFLPFPFSPFGTLGSFISLKEMPRNRRALLDIGIAGPLAGLVVAIPVLLLGLSLSKVSPLPLTMPKGNGFELEGNSILYLLLKYSVFHQWLPTPASFRGLPPLFYWVRYFFTGQPAPLGGVDVMLHPVAWAGWAGILVTSLNLVPSGQLDGGHLLYVLLGKRMDALQPFLWIILIILGIFWPGWYIWLFLLFLVGRYHAEPLDQITPLDGRRKMLAVLVVFIFFLVFTPIPLVTLSF